MQLLQALIVSLATIGVLGIIIAFSPTLFITELAILTRSKRPLIQSIAFITGISLAVLLFCIVALLLFDPAKQLTIPSTREVIHSTPAADMIVGVLLLVFGVKLLRPKVSEDSLSQQHSPKAGTLLSTKALFWFGFIKMATSLSSIAAIILATRFIMTSVATGGMRAASVAWLVVVAVFPFVLILLWQQYWPERFAKVQRVSDRVVGVNWRRVIAITMVGFGGYFIINSLLHWGG